MKKRNKRPSARRKEKKYMKLKMEKLIIHEMNQHSHPIVNNNFDFSHATIIIGSNNKVGNHEEVKETPSREQGSAKDKSQSCDWRKTSEIINVILKVIKTLLIIATPLFNLLC